MSVSDYAIKHPAVITIVLVAVLLFGVFSLFTTPQAVMPNITLPTVFSFVPYPGASPQTVEKDVVKPVEDELATIDGLKRLTSYSIYGGANFKVEFYYGNDVKVKENDVRNGFNNVASDLPSLSQTPSVRAMTGGGNHVMDALVSSPSMSDVELYWYFYNTVEAELSQIKGTSSVDLYGFDEPYLRVSIDPDKLKAHGLDFADLNSYFDNNNVAYPAGQLVFNNNMSIMTADSRFTTVADVNNAIVGYTAIDPLSSSGSPSITRVKDIGKATIETRHPTSYNLSTPKPNGVYSPNLGLKRAHLISISQQTDGDPVYIAKRATKVLANATRAMNGAVQFSILSSSSKIVKATTNSVVTSAWQGIVIAIIVIFLALGNLRSTIIIGVSIPITILIAIMLMKLKGLSLNLMSLTGMTAALGSIVDPAIVILENINKKYRPGVKAEDAASLGASEVSSAVIASTTTNLCVLLPLFGVTGFMGIFLKQISWVLIFTLSAAAVTAVVAVPYFYALLYRGHIRPKVDKGWEMAVQSKFDAAFGKIASGYEVALRFCLSHKTFVLITAVLILFLSFKAFRLVGFNLLPDLDTGEIRVSLETPQGYTLDETQAVAKKLYPILRARVPEIVSDSYVTGDKGSNRQSGDSYAQIHLYLAPIGKARTRSVNEIVKDLRLHVPQLFPGTKILIVNGFQTGNNAGGASSYAVEVHGQTFENTLAAANLFKSILEKDPDTTSVDMDVNTKALQVSAKMDQEYMAFAGVTASRVGQVLNAAFTGYDTNYNFNYSDGNAYTLTVESPYVNSVANKEDLGRIAVKNNEGTFIPLRSFIDFKTEPSVDQITHIGKLDTITLTAYMTTTNNTAIANRTTAQFNSLSLPQGVGWKPSGNAQDQKTVFRQLGIAMLIALFLDYMVMVIQFERFIQPFIIMFAIPFCLIGVIAAGLGFHATFNAFSIFAFITLMGMVVNAAIVLIDYTNMLRIRDKMPLYKALVTGAGDRLRPILMSVLTTVLGLYPLAIAKGEGGSMFAPVGQAMFGGMISSTMITLFLVPVAYYILETPREKKRLRLEAEEAQLSSDDSSEDV